MRIGIDAQAAEKKGGGNCTYIQNLLLALKEVDQKNEYFLYVLDRTFPFYENFKSAANFHIKQLRIKNPILRIPIFLAWKTFKDALDILHVQWHAPFIFKGKLVATIHDLGFLHIPETFSKIDVWRAKVIIRMTARKAKRIITGTDFSKDDIIKNYKLNKNKMAVVPYGISTCFNMDVDPVKIQEIRDKYCLQGPYILSVGRLNPRKNMLSLVKAFSLLKEKKSIPHKVVIVGKNDFKTKEILLSISAIDPSHDVVFTGYVEDSELCSLYHGASVFVYPSLFEGVGLPALEAMSCGVPVVASNSTSLGEIVEGAGLLVDPLDIEEMAEAIFRLIKDENLRKVYIEKGLTKVKSFSWKDHAKKTLELYEGLKSRDLTIRR